MPDPLPDPFGSPASTCQTLAFVVAAVFDTVPRQVNCRGDLEQVVECFDFQASRFEELDRRAATGQDAVTTIRVTDNFSRFVDPITNSVKTRISFRSNAISGQVITGRFDHAYWTIAD